MTTLKSSRSPNPAIFSKTAAMDIFIPAMFVAIGAYMLQAKYQRRRIALLASHLGNYQIEKLMESLSEGYMRALGEADVERRQQIWNLLTTTETALVDQIRRFADGFSRVDEADARVSKFALTLPYADRLFPGTSFDLRKALSIHAQGVANAAKNDENKIAKSKAFTLSAELFLMQHTCHWFCKSKSVASARMLVRHKTSYEQLVASVAPDTRKAYCALTAR